MNHHRPTNTGVHRFALSLPKGEARSLCNGGTIEMVGFGSGEYFLSVHHNCRAIELGKKRTGHTVESYLDKREARNDAKKLSAAWRYRVMDGLDDARQP